MIEVSNLSRSFDSKKVLKDISFSVPKGNVAAFLGPNGAGKTTTIKILAGVLRPTSGEVKICGISMWGNQNEALRQIGYLPESIALYKELSILDYLSFFADIKGMSARFFKSRLEYVAETFNIKDRLHSPISILSQGWRQRVGLAQAVLADPPALLLDEPTSGLDPQQIKEFRSFLDKTRLEKTIFLSTHILGEAEKIADKILIINHGALVRSEDRKLQETKIIHLKILRNSNAVRLAITNLKEIVKVLALEKKPGELKIEIKNNERLPENLEALSKICVDLGAGLVELSSQSHTIEDIFHQSTQAQQP